MKTLLFLIAFSVPCFATDDYVMGKYNHLDKLIIEGDEWQMEVSGEGKYVAEFLEIYYDNISENYRTNPILRKKVLEQMEKAKKEGKKSFFFKEDKYWQAFQTTSGM